MRVPVPFKHKDRVAAYESRASREEIHEAYRASKTRSIPLSLLTATQRTVGSERLMQYASDPNTPAHNGPPTIVHAGNKFFIHNGHHRATLAAMRGERALDGVRVAHLDPLEPRRFGHPGQLLMMQPEATSVLYQAHDVQDVADVIDGGIAVICIDTPLEDKPGGSWWSYFDDYESIHCRFANAIESDDVRGVFLKIDSPGGTAAGLNECVDSMLRLAAKTKKPVWSYADEGAYSAAYALALVGDRIYLPRAGGLGSIGVISQIVSFAEGNKKFGVDFRVYTSGKRKADGNPNLPITDEAEAHVQRRVDQLAKIYFKLAAERRSVSRSFVRGLEADTFYGKDAVRKKLADGVISLESCIEAFRKVIDTPAGNKVTSSGKRDVAPERDNGMTPEEKRVKKATTALQAAVGSKARAAALVEFNAANAALAKTMTKPGATKPSAGKHYKKTETLDHSTDSSSGSEEEEEEEEMPSASASTGSSMPSSSGSEEEEEETEEEEKALAAMVRRVTGKTSAKEALGALLALGEKAKGDDKNAKRIARLEATRKQDKVEALIAQGRKDAKVTPGNEKKLRAIAKEHGYRALRSFLDASHAAVLPELPDPPLDAEVEQVKLSASDKKILAKMGIGEDMHGKFAKYLSRRDAERAGKAIPERGMPRDLVSRAKSPETEE